MQTMTRFTLSLIRGQSPSLGRPRWVCDYVPVIHTVAVSVTEQCQAGLSRDTTVSDTLMSINISLISKTLCDRFRCVTLINLILCCVRFMYQIAMILSSALYKEMSCCHDETIQWPPDWCSIIDSSTNPSPDSGHGLPDGRQSNSPVFLHHYKFKITIPISMHPN